MIKNIAIVGRKILPDHLPFFEECIQTCNQHNIVLYISEPLADELRHFGNMQPFNDFKDGDFKNFDFVFSIGGDGTFLRTARLINTHQVPILGVNTGRLGFLAETGIHDLNVALKELINGDYLIADRTVLSVTEDNEPNAQYALNDVTLLRRDTSSLIVAHVKVNGKLLNNYWSDGLIISTPTGSTAYSMSAGGPIVYPQSNNIIITPIAPHSFNVRPLVLPDNVELEIIVESRSDNFMLTVDTSSKVVHTETKVNIRKADYCVKEVQRNSYDFFETLQKKLMWGVDIRTSNK